MLPLALRVAALVTLGSVSAVASSRALGSVNTDLLAVSGTGSNDGSSLNAHDEAFMSVARQTVFFTVSGAIAAWLLSDQPVAQEIVSAAALIAVFATILKNQLTRRIFARVSRGRLSIEHRLGDILVSDTLVSFAPVMVDLAWAIYCLAVGTPSSEQPRSSMPSYAVLAACFPAGIRMRQCYADWRRTRQRQHLANMAKYFVGNISVSVRFQMLQLAGTAEAQQHARMLPYALAANSIYSLYWDIFKDWNMPQVGIPGSPARFSKRIYMVAIMFDSVARFSWLFAKPDERVVFALQLLEIIRRAAWIPLRVDSEPRTTETFSLPTLERAHQS